MKILSCTSYLFTHSHLLLCYRVIIDNNKNQLEHNLTKLTMAVERGHEAKEGLSE